METVVELKVIKETTEDFEEIEKRIKQLFKQEIYLPLLKEFGEPSTTLQNADDRDAVAKALKAGRLSFSRGKFSGKFTAETSKQLKQLGAKWDRTTASFKLPLFKVPTQLKLAISTSEAQFVEKMDRVDAKLRKILPEEFAGRLKTADLFDRTIFKTEKSFAQSVKRIGITPTLTATTRKKIAEEYAENIKLKVKDFTKEEVTKLRAQMQKSVFAGKRYESAISSIHKSFGVTASKAKFLARQESSLLITKFQESRYVDAGVNEYRWRCVTGTKAHPVRPAHKRLEGKIFRWDNPPITSEPGQPVRKNNPGQDYFCRCFARPRVRFKT